MNFLESPRPRSMALLAALAIGACGSPHASAANSATGASGEEAQGASTASASSTPATAASAPPAGPAFTATPSIDEASAGAVHGTLNDIAVEAEEISLRNTGGHWSLHLSRVRPYFEITLPLHEAPRAGARQGSTVAETPGTAVAGAIQVPHPTLGAVSWNGDQVGWALEITALDARPCAHRVRADRDTGTAGGRVVIATHDPFGQHPDGRLDGTFAGVVVRCLATP